MTTSTQKLWGRLACLLWLAGAAACSSATPPPTSAPERVILIDPTTSQLFEATTTIVVPAMNPRTGKQTLQNALYCERCRRWHPTPPLEIVQRTPAARQCRKTGALLSKTGPLPADIVQLSKPNP